MGLVLLLGGSVLQAQDPLILRPEGAGDFFFPSRNPVPRSIAGGEELVLEYGSWSLLLQPGFNPYGRTLVQIYLDSRRMKNLSAETLAHPGPSAQTGNMEFSRPWGGGTLNYTPMAPDRVTLIGERKEVLFLSGRPSGILMFFETGGDVFWLGNGTEFFCYDSRGEFLSRYNLADTALMATADSRGSLYLAFSDGTVRNLPPRRREDRSFQILTLDAWEIFDLCYDNALALIESDYPDYKDDFKRWAREKGEALYREDPLNRELGEFVRSLRNN